MADIPADDFKGRRSTEVCFRDGDMGKYEMQGYEDPSWVFRYYSGAFRYGDAHLLLVASYEPRDGADKAEKEEAMRVRIKNTQRWGEERRKKCAEL
jgi:hypothetical protein